jgi:hypothetical protein
MTRSLVVMDPVRGVGQASGQINGADSILIELVQADETPAVVIIRWPSKPSVLHPLPIPHSCRYRCPHFRCCRRTAGPDQTGPQLMTRRWSLMLALNHRVVPCLFLFW